MQSLSARIFSLLSAVLLAASFLLRFFSIVHNLSETANIVLYALIAIGLSMITVSAIKENDYLSAFNFNNNKKMSIASYAASAGFFINFVHQCVVIYQSVENGEFKAFSFFVPACLACLSALLSCFYFFTIGMSYSDNGYDFRKLKVLHIVPVLWAIANVLAVMTVAVSPLKDAGKVMKFAMLVCAVAFFYFLAVEIENKKGAKKATVLFSKAFSYLALMFFADRVMLLLSRDVVISDSDSVFSLVVIMIAVFAFFFQKDIIKNSIIKGA